MDIAVKERLVGAAVLVVIVVLVVPALLSGPRAPVAPEAPPEGDTRVVEIDLAGSGDRREAPPPAEPLAPLPAEPGDSAAPQQAPAVAVAEVPDMAPPVAVADTPPAQQAPPEPVPAPAEAGWAVQVAALSKQDAAEALAARLKGKGFPAYVLEHRSGGQVLYRVRVGPEAQRERAESLAGRLREEGLNPAIVSQP